MGREGALVESGNKGAGESPPSSSPAWIHSVRRSPCVPESNLRDEPLPCDRITGSEYPYALFISLLIGRAGGTGS